MLEGMAQLPDAMYVLGTPEMETFISLLKNGDTAYALVQIATGGSHGKMELMGALQDRLIFIEKKGTDHLIIPYSEINRVEVSYGWVACGISIHKKDGNLIDFNSVLKVASKHFDSWFSSHTTEDVSETELQPENLDLDFSGALEEAEEEVSEEDAVSGLGALFENETPKPLAKAGNELGHFDDRPGSRHSDYYLDSKDITRTVIERLIKNIGWKIEEEGSSVWRGGTKKPASPNLIYAKVGWNLRSTGGERIIVNIKLRKITSEAAGFTVIGKNKSNVNKLKELINVEGEPGRLNEKRKEKEVKEKVKGVLYSATNEWGDTIEVYEDFIDITYVDLQVGMFDILISGTGARPEFEKDCPEIDIGGWWFDLKFTRKLFCSESGRKRIKNKDIRRVKFIKNDIKGFIKINLEPGLFIFFGNQETWWPIAQHLGKISALEAEKNLDEERAIKIFDEFLLPSEAKRIRQKIQDEGRVKVDQTVVHGDYVDDRDTIVKDSVVSKSNIGAGSDDKIAKLEKIAEMKDKGIIDDDEFKQMKKEILGK
jgi:hypothetical protein